MADNPQTLSAVLNALAQNFRDQVVKTVNRRSVLLKTLRVQPGEGKNVAWDAEFDGMVAETFNDGDDAQNFGSDLVAPATLSWALFRSNFRITDLAMAASATSRTPAGLMNLLGRNIVNSSAKLASTINAACYSSTTGLIGLDTALRDDNTYAGIDRTDPNYALWKSNVFDPGSPTAPTLDQIRDDITVSIYKACGEQPDIALCPPEVFRKLGSLFTELRRYNQQVTEMNTARGMVTLDASVGAIEFEGCVFIKDKDATANTIYYLNSNYVHIEFLPQPVGGLGEASDAHDAPMDDGFGPVPLGMKVKPLAVTGSSRKASSQVFTQLVVTKPSAMGRRKNVLTT